MLTPNMIMLLQKYMQRTTLCPTVVSKPNPASRPAQCPNRRRPLPQVPGSVPRQKIVRLRFRGCSTRSEIALRLSTGQQRRGQYGHHSSTSGIPTFEQFQLLAEESLIPRSIKIKIVHDEVQINDHQKPTFLNRKVCEVGPSTTCTNVGVASNSSSILRDGPLSSHRETTRSPHRCSDGVLFRSY